MTFARGGFALPAIALLLAIGCGDADPTAPEIEIYRPQNSVENVLYNLEQAYERRDLPAYEKLFADSFYFRFDPSDVAEDPDIPEEWGLEDELTSASNMFTDLLTETITVDFVVGDPVAATEGDVILHTFPNGTTKVVVTEVQLEFDTRDPQGGENIVYQVTGDRAFFFLYPHPTESVGGLPVWYIIEWRDQKVDSLAERPGGGVAARHFATAETSWGGIKNAYR